ncbi:MAG: sulfite exporter TauE/SafE family protein, partial [Deltaproteobacteria bacterium]|nr:sulfite exporter TauE/SafE family protein [Deltaproteobacteria bacterium]
GTLPGVAIGAVLRVKYLPDPRFFKFFVGLVLLYIGFRLVYDLFSQGNKASAGSKALEEKFNQRLQKAREQKTSRFSSGLPPEARVKTLEISLKKISYAFYGETFTFSTLGVTGLSFLVGIVGGTYGIGGGAILAPFFVTFFGLPVYTIAGATLGATFLTSVFGVVFYQFIVPLFVVSDLSVKPDWLLGAAFGLGGLAGIYLGARFQRFVPARFIKIVLATILIIVAARYVSQLFF